MSERYDVVSSRGKPSSSAPLDSPLGSAKNPHDDSLMTRIAVTIGDPAGIGPEVTSKALASGQLPDCIEWEVLGSDRGIEPGKPSETSAHMAIDSLNDAAKGLIDGRYDAVVTGPVSKDGLQSVGFTYPGQTEFFAGAFGVDDYGMLLTGEHLVVGLATIHNPLAKAVQLLSMDHIIRIGRLTADFLRKRGNQSPRIAVAGLNPHAGEAGRMGSEEKHIIAPAIEALNETRLAEFAGPGIPDAVFRATARGSYDAIIAMYHDQGLIPLKLLDFDNAVNVTLGLPKPRTSPDHGTAFEIAGKGIANPSSMIAAMKLAAELA